MITCLINKKEGTPVTWRPDTDSAPPFFNEEGLIVSTAEEVNNKINISVFEVRNGLLRTSWWGAISNKYFGAVEAKKGYQQAPLNWAIAAHGLEQGVYYCNKDRSKKFEPTMIQTVGELKESCASRLVKVLPQYDVPFNSYFIDLASQSSLLFKKINKQGEQFPWRMETLTAVGEADIQLRRLKISLKGRIAVNMMGINPILSGLFREFLDTPSEAAAPKLYEKIETHFKDIKRAVEHGEKPSFLAPLIESSSYKLVKIVSSLATLEGSRDDDSISVVLYEPPQMGEDNPSDPPLFVGVTGSPVTVE
jgi:hypothetical protein